MNHSVALVIVFNHRYEKNISVLEEVYKSRFSHIYFLVPFYQGNKKNVIPVYDTSVHFQGYLAQGYKNYFDETYEHFFFIADDLLLNPAINENNYKEHFGLTGEASFIAEIQLLHSLSNNSTLRFLPAYKDGRRWFWSRLHDIINYSHRRPGAETAFEMPSYAEAKKKLEKHGYPVRDLDAVDVFGDLKSFDFPPGLRTKVKLWLKLIRHRKGFKLAYPMVASYSDIIIIHKSTIKQFIHYCGVFSVHGLFVELAVPTALLLSSNKVVTEPLINKRGEIFWLYTEKEIAAYKVRMKPYNSSLSTLLQKFPADILYIHPIKLSEWIYQEVEAQL